MKKLLLGTTALVAATAVTAGTAKAEMAVSGWNTFGFGASSVEGTGDAARGQIDVYENGEIFFDGSTELDNGMTVGWSVQLETEAGLSGNVIDENYFTIAGDFGTVIIGQENLPAYKMHYTGGMWVGNNGLSSTGITAFIGNPGTSWFHNGFMNDAGPITGDNDMVSYYTPRMGGIQLGVGWAPDSAINDGSASDTNGAGHGFEDVLSIGANYQGDMDGTSVGVSVGFTDIAGGTSLTTNSGLRSYQAGLNVGMGGLTFGLSWFAMDDDAVVKAGDADTFMVGVTYSTGAHTIGLTGSFGNAEETTADTDDTEGSAIMLAHDYALGGGASFSSAVTWIDVDDELNVSDDGVVGMFLLNAGF